MSVVTNLLLLLPASYLSFIAWFTKFSHNTPAETLIARIAGLATLVGVVLAVTAGVLIRSSPNDSKRSSTSLLIIASWLGVLPFMMYIMMKIF